MIFSNSNKDDLYYDIRNLFVEGGTLEEFFDVLHYFMEDFELKEKKGAVMEIKIVKKCHWCKQELYEKDITKQSNARGFGYYIVCPNCGNRNVIQEIDLTREML